ncbi:hypothetical protein GCM10028806_50950 [Spirosoma terrae]
MGDLLVFDFIPKMRGAISTILWGILCITPLAVIYYIFKAFTSEYDEDIAAFICALGLGCLTIVVLITLKIIDESVYLQRHRLRLYAGILGTPFTPLFAYFMAWFIAALRA